MALSNSTVVAIIIIVAVTSGLLLLVGLILYRKYYANQRPLMGK
jgi:Na+/melibiose symporter-like transporter